MAIGKKVSNADDEAKSVLNLQNPVFKKRQESSKIVTVVKELEKLKHLKETKGVVEKAVIVSQWTSMLEIVKVHVERMGLRCAEINGKKIIFRGQII